MDLRPYLPSLAIVVLAALAFALLAGMVASEAAPAFDRALLLALREPADLADPLGPAWLEDMARDVTAFGGNGILVLISLAVAGYLALTGKRGAALLVLVAVGGGMGLSSLLKDAFARARPDVVSHLARVHTASFPSSHAMLSAVAYLTLGALLARVQPGRRVKAYLLGLAVLLTLLVGASRVYLGVHWPTDVLGGWCIGVAWAALCWAAALALQRRGKVERPAGDKITRAARTPR